MNYNQKNSRTNRPLTKEELFTSNKRPELAVFYNIAFFRFSAYLSHLLGNKFESNKDKLEQTFTEWMNSLKSGADKLSQKDYSVLRNYLWKGYQLNKNSSGYHLEETDKKRIRELVQILYKVRNFHSHIWHDNAALIISEDISRFISELFERAILHNNQTDPSGVTNFNEKRKDLYKNHNGKIYLTIDGRIFLLSLFLTSGEMSKLLQQSSGYKRNEGPFKLKQSIFKFYCHRDGASRFHYGVEEHMLNSLPEEEQNEILSARQALKLYNYLNDVPAFSLNTDLFPLYTNEKIKVTDAASLILFCNEKEILPGWNKRMLTTVNTAGQTVEKKNVIEIFRESDATIIQLSVIAFHKIILDALRHTDYKSYFFKVETKLLNFIAERKLFADVLEGKIPLPESTEENNKITLNSFVDEYYRFKLRAGDHLVKTLGKLLDSIDKNNKQLQDKKTKEVLHDLLKEIKTAPIELSYYDFYFEETFKPRKENLFVQFACRYLIDFKIVPEWKWMIESVTEEKKEITKEVFGKKVKQQVTVLRKRPVFVAQPAFNQRILITNDDHVTVAIPVTDGEKEPGIEPAFKFVLGYKAITNLLIAHFKEKNIADFFDPVIKDLTKIKSGEVSSISSLELLGKNEIPEVMLKHMNVLQSKTRTELVEMAKKRIKSLKSNITAALSISAEDLKRQKRAEINRQIIKWYQFFDWQYPQQSAFKFLRKDEFNLMSVYHYCLEKKNERRDKYEFLLTDIRPHMPKEIISILQKATSIYNLHTLVANEVKQYLDKVEKVLQDTGKADAAILQKLGISAGKGNIEDWRHFNIHPILPVKKYFAIDLKKDNGNFSLSKQIRNNPGYINSLSKTHYNTQAYLMLGKEWPELEKLHKTIIGETNSALCQDALLAILSNKYFGKMGAAYKQVLEKKGKNFLAITNLRQQVFTIPFNIAEGLVKMNIKFHQLDDYLLIESKPVIEKAVALVQRRLKNEGITDKPTEQIISYDEVFREIQNVFNRSLHWAAYILNWEKEVLEKTPLQQKNALGKNKAPKMEYINFMEICKLGTVNDTLSNKLRNLRNTILHAELPREWTYEELEADKELCDLLHFIPKQPYPWQQLIPEWENKK